MKWASIKQTSLYKGFFEVVGYDLKHDLFAGGESPMIRRELVSHQNASAVLPYDPVRDEVVLIEQFRIGAKDREAGPWLMEIIAGYQEPGESPEDVVVREAMEEAGCTLTEVRPMLHYYSTPGGSSERIYCYLGRTSTEGLGGIHGLADESEDIRVHIVSPQTAFEWLENGRIDSATAVVAIQWFQQHYAEIRQEWLA